MKEAWIDAWDHLIIAIDRTLAGLIGGSMRVFVQVVMVIRCSLSGDPPCATAPEYF